MKKEKDPRVKTSVFPIQGFILSFIALAFLTTGQMLILRDVIDISALSSGYIIAAIVYWIMVAAVFTIFTRRQVVKYYQKPMEEFAEATKKVAEGDFSEIGRAHV